MRALKGFLALLVILASTMVLFSYAGVALASSGSVAATRLALAAPSEAALGRQIRLDASLKDDVGQPVPRATIRFYVPASFLSGASGLMRIGDAATDGQGIAALEYVPRQNLRIRVLAEYQGDSRYAPSQAATEINVVGNEQLYEAEAGIKVPYVSKWLLVGFLGAVWGTIFFVVLLVVRVALAPPE